MEILIMMQGICKQLKWLLGIRRRKCLSHGYFTYETKKKAKTSQKGQPHVELI